MIGDITVVLIIVGMFVLVSIKLNQKTRKSDKKTIKLLNDLKQQVEKQNNKLKIDIEALRYVTYSVNKTIEITKEAENEIHEKKQRETKP